MKKFLSSFNNRKKIFLADTDSYTIIENAYTENDLIFKIKLATLLYDVVLIPAAFTWQSKQMANIMYKIQPLIQTENIIPVIRDREITRDIKDYFEKREEETSSLKNKEIYKKPSLASEIATKANKSDADALHKMDCYLHLEETSVKEEFIKLWHNDLCDFNDYNSIAVTLFQNIEDVQQYKLLLNILKTEVDYEQFSRSNLVNFILALNIPNNIKSLLEKRISWLYLKANATAFQSDFYLSDPLNYNVVSEANILLFFDLLNHFGINKYMILNLTCEEIIRIKKTPQYIDFIEKYNSLLKDINYEYKDIVTNLNKKIDSSFKEEKVKKKILRILPGILNASSTIFIGLLVNYFSNNSIDNRILTFSGATSIITTIVTFNAAINKTPFIDFKEYIIKQEYKRQLQESINGVII